MSTPGFVDTEVEIFPEVSASLIAYMRRRGCSFNVAVNHALRVLGGVDAAKQACEKVQHVPGYAAQCEVAAYQLVYGEEVHLEKLGRQLTTQARKVPVELSEEAYNSLRAYMQSYNVPQAGALMHAAFLLTICSHGDLWVQQAGKKPQRMVIE